MVNKTKKNKKTNNKINTNNKTQKITCNSFQPFEDKVEKLFKENNLDILSQSYNLETEVVKDLKKAVSPSQIKPENDFYSYINERWLKNINVNKEQQYIVQIDNFRLVQDKVYRQLIEIIENYIKNNNSNTKLYSCIKNAYQSFKGYNTTKQTKEYAHTILTHIDEIIEKGNVWQMLAFVNSNEIISSNAPFVWTISPDDKNPKIYECYIEPPQVTLLDIDIYFDDKPDTKEIKQYKNKYRNRYSKYLDDIFTIAFGEKHGFNVKDVYECERIMLNAMECNAIKTNNEDENYNVVKKDESIKIIKFDWESFCIHLGFSKVPSHFITSNINYLLCFTKILIEEWSTPKWRTYWIYIYINQLIRWDKKGSLLFYNFHGNFLRGQQTPIDPQIRPIFGMSFLFNTFLTNQYVKIYQNKERIEYTKALAEDLKIVFKRIIRRNNWLQLKTKETALDKLDNLRFIIGSLDTLRKDPILPYKNNDIWGNLLKKVNWRHKQAIQLVGKHVINIPVINWNTNPPKMDGNQAYIVNAMYVPVENSIYIPLAYLQNPFIDLNERGIEYNLAHIGFTIAHEMSHALDDLGSKYDKNGKLTDWWSTEDKKHFSKIQKNIVKQYETYALRDNIQFDAWPTIGEDLADISGFTICQEYLRDIQLKNKNTLPIQSLAFKTFFVYFAIQSRQKLSKKSILAQLKNNPHPLDKYRCNVPLSRSRIFRTLFNVKKGDGMWWNSLNDVWAT
jgi:predicted metalloendopeptidase